MQREIAQLSSEPSAVGLKLYRLLMVFLLVVIALKFSQQYHVVQAWTCNFAELFWSDWAPSFSFVLISLTGLVNLCLFRRTAASGLWIFGVLWLSILPGWLGHHQDYLWLMWGSHLGSAFLLYWQMNRWFACDLQARKIVIYSLSGICILFALWAWWQCPLGGFEALERETLAYFAENGETLPPQILKRLSQRRAYGPFGYPNVYAACLLLLTPLTLYTAYTFLKHRLETKIGQFLLFGLTILFILGAICFSGSRTVLPAVFLAIVVWFVLKEGTRQSIKLAAIASSAGLMGLVGMMWLISVISERNPMASLTVRLEYWQTALKIFMQSPWFGVGWGEFFPHYICLKEVSYEVTHTPHNVLLKFMTQCGIGGGFAILALMLKPLWDFYRHSARQTIEIGCVFLGIAAFLGHSLADFNFWYQSPVLFLAIMMALLNEAKGKKKSSFRHLTVGVMIILFANGIILLQAYHMTGSLEYLARNYCADSQTVCRGLPLEVYRVNFERALIEKNEKLARRYQAILLQQAPHHAHVLVQIACSLPKTEIVQKEKLLQQARHWGKGDNSVEKALSETENHVEKY